MVSTPRIYINGLLYDKADAKISVYDHGFLYGDGVFEGIRAYSGKIFRLDAHLRRLYNSARAIRLAIPLSPEQLGEAIQQTVKANNFQDCYIRAVVTRGVGYLGLNPAKCANPSVFIIADTIEMYPREVYDKGMAVITASVIRNHPNAVSPRVKLQPGMDGPKPMENVRTWTSHHLAARKWPSSWMKITKPRPTTTREAFHRPSMPV